MRRRRRGCSRCSPPAMSRDRRSTDRDSRAGDRASKSRPVASTFVGDRASAIEQSNWPALQGPHNRAERRCGDCDVPMRSALADDADREGLRTYPGLPHRMERIREKDGVLFVNDSKATNPTATAPALAAFERIRWICGGQAKTDNLDECAPHFGHVAHGLYDRRGGRIVRCALVAAHGRGRVRNAGRGGAARPRRRRSRAIRCCCRRPARRSTSSAISRTRGDQFRQLVGAL